MGNNVDDMVLARAERDYKADMEALSLEIEQVARNLLEF